MVPELRRALREAGFEIYRTGAGEVQLAERVRENLIMDSGVRVRVDGEDGSLRVAFLSRAQQRDFPGENPALLFERARELVREAIDRGFSEVRELVTPMPDPSDPERALDQLYEVELEKRVAGLDEAFDEVRFAFALEKTAKR